MGALLMDGCRDLQRRHPWIGDVRGQGLVLGIELVDAESKAPDAERAAVVVQEAAQRGLLLIAPIGLHGNVLRLAPPLIITREQIEQALTIFGEVCRAVEAPVAVGA